MENSENSKNSKTFFINSAVYTIFENIKMKMEVITRTKIWIVTHACVRMSS